MEHFLASYSHGICVYLSYINYFVQLNCGSRKFIMVMVFKTYRVKLCDFGIYL